VRTSRRLNERGIAFGLDGRTLCAVDAFEFIRVDTSTGTVIPVGFIRDANGQGCRSDNLAWDPVTGRFVSMFHVGPGRAQPLALIDPVTAEATIIAPVSVDSCTIVRAPHPVPGPGGVDWPAGTWFTIDRTSRELVTIEVDVAAGTARVGTRIGSLGPESSGMVCGTAFAPPQAPRPPDRIAECVCDAARQKVPRVAIDYALANPDRIMGWNQLLNPGVPGAPLYPTPGHDRPPNPRRTCLDLKNRNIRWHPTYNNVIWQAACTP
jgi:hypothetical protein